GEGNDTLSGGEGNDNLTGGPGNDLFNFSGYSDRYRGDSSDDKIVFEKFKNQYLVVATEAGLNITDNTTGLTSYVWDVEILEFTDSTMDVAVFRNSVLNP
ncbi:MAG: hypothetical protein GY786_09315, partial [Proteobacteria bacterium]|nr:hypothetical protein [Pseudomonadota bacterium]